MKDTTGKLRRRRRTLIARLRSADLRVMRGSLIERYKKCGKAGCRCADGRGHGPKYYLSVSMPGRRPEMVYVPQDYLEEVKEHVENLAVIRGLLEELCELNRELLKRRESL